MLELADRLLPPLLHDVPVAAATVTSVNGRSPTTPGTSMALTADGAVIGDLSRTCTEVRLLHALHTVLRGGSPRTVHEHAQPWGEAPLPADLLAAQDAHSEPTTDQQQGCATLRVLLHRLDTHHPPTRLRLLDTLQSAAAGRAARVGLVIDGPTGVVGDLVFDVDGAEAEGGGVLLRAGRAVFVDVQPAAAQLVVIGCGEVARHLAQLATVIGYRVSICDPRPVFATAERAGDSAQVVVELPHRYLQQAQLSVGDAVCLLTHDDDLDAAALDVALRSRASYVGAMGSRRTHAARLRRLAVLGLSQADLLRLRGPIGLDLGAVAPAEIAMAIAAELVATARGATGLPLSWRCNATEWADPITEG